MPDLLRSDTNAPPRAHPESSGGRRWRRLGWRGPAALGSLLVLMSLAYLLVPEGHESPTSMEDRSLLPAIPARSDAEATLAGALTSVGSDAMNNVMLSWTSAFADVHPRVYPTVDSKGSSRAPLALVAGDAMLGPMARPMKDEERRGFLAHFGYPPTMVRVAFDAIGIYVKRDNPVPSLEIAQLRSLYATLNRTSPRTWADLGVAAGWESIPVRPYGRNSASLIFYFMRSRVLAGDGFRLDVVELPGSASVVQAVAGDIGGIGYGGVGYETAGVRALPIAKGTLPPAEPTPENVRAGHYPLSRPLFVCVCKDPREGVSPLVRAFLEFVLSRSGQDLAGKDGLISLSAAQAAEEVARLR